MERFCEPSRTYRMKIPFLLVFLKSFSSEISKQDTKGGGRKIDLIVLQVHDEFDVLPLWEPSDKGQNQPREHP